jgi:hypothetical protein
MSKTSKGRSFSRRTLHQLVSFRYNFPYSLIYGLSTDAVRSSDCIASNGALDRMRMELVVS